MNKLSRILGSTALATGLIFSGSAGAAFANDNDYRDSHKSYDRSDRYDRDKDRDDGRNSGYRHDDDRYFIICFDRWGKGHYKWGKKDDDDRKNCFIVYPIRRY
jgi:Ni/Co efflux regulator RcnB